MINDPPTSCCKGDTEYPCDYGGTGVAANYASPKEQRLASRVDVLSCPWKFMV